MAAEKHPQTICSENRMFLHHFYKVFIVIILLRQEYNFCKKKVPGP